ncbi:AMP-binding protein [Opitutus sp. ER46]|uniref:AMP-binding protein n=1 Tax=Opitutus sp. ER46 TaxID=2161864 RepID=UPI000D322540|nr:AMP-binding protein [Opitutus sp. ER46]PTX99003.1 AMP-dependent synthetase [Opitutus sp. ER46]
MPRPVLRRRSLLPFWIEAVALLIARLLYRVRSSGTENFPQTGGVVLIANHLSYVDAIVLQLACPRPIRFLSQELFEGSLLFRFCVRLGGCIPISPRQPAEGFKRAAKALRAGEVVCLFPEGQISRTGQLMQVRKSFELLARQAKVPVVAAAHDGLWGSVFSFAGNKYLWKSPRLLPTPVFVAMGKPQAYDQATTAWARQELLDLGAVAFEERPVLRRNLARECIRGLTKHPQHVQVIDRTADRKVLKNAQLYAAAAVLCQHLKKTVPDDRIGVVLPPGIGAFVANLAILCAGKHPVNMNFTAGRASIEASFRVGKVSTIISANALRTKVPNFPWPEKTLDLPTVLGEAGGKKAMIPWLLAAWLLPNQWCANLLHLPKVGDRTEAGLLFTSGSAGEPKGVVLTHRNVLANCAQFSSLSILPESCSLMGCLPIFHSFGFTVTLWYPMMRGCQIVTVPSPLDTRKIIDAIAEEKVTIMISAPTFLRPLLKKAQPHELKSLDVVVSGAEKLPDDLYRAFLQTFHIEILQGYGLTETSPVANVNQPHPPIAAATNRPQIGKRLGATGRMMPGMTARILDPDTGKERSATETGIVAFRGANVFGGYLNEPEKTGSVLKDGWFVTGDLGRFDEDGFLFIEGRLSRFSKIGGEMVPHGTVEQKIIDVFAWEPTDSPQLVVTAVPDEAKGEALVLLTTREVSAEELRGRLLEAGLPGLWIPRIIHRVEALPLLGTGKMDIKGCRTLALTLTANGTRSAVAAK